MWVLTVYILFFRYHIEKFNVDDLLFLILPYHETTHFAQMLQILKISKDTGRWHWLYQVKMQRIPLSKTALLNRAASDMSFLKFVCDMPAQAIKVIGYYYVKSSEAINKCAAVYKIEMLWMLRAVS